MYRSRAALTYLLSLSVSSLAACDVDEPLDVDGAELRDLSAPYRNTEVVIENIDSATCLAFDPNASSFPLERPCDGDDRAQRFRFEVQTFVGGLGFVYEVCSAKHPTMCLRHHSDGTAVFVDEEQLASLEGTWFDQVRIQHDEDKAFIEFRYSGECLTPGDPPTAQTCDWFGSTAQQYRLRRACSFWDQDCPDGETCRPSVADDGSWDIGACAPLEPSGDQPGDPCQVYDDAATNADSCDGSSMCFYVSPGTNLGICTPYCQGDAVAPICVDPRSACVVFDDALPLCLQACDPFSPDCPAEQECALEPGNHVFACVPSPTP